jgi:hypothetical protein
MVDIRTRKEDIKADSIDHTILTQVLNNMVIQETDKQQADNITVNKGQATHRDQTHRNINNLRINNTHHGATMLVVETRTWGNNNAQAYRHVALHIQSSVKSWTLSNKQSIHNTHHALQLHRQQPQILKHNASNRRHHKALFLSRHRQRHAHQARIRRTSSKYWMNRLSQ